MIAPGPVPSAAAEPKFAFDLGPVRPITTGKKKDVRSSARAAARHISQTLDRLYVTGTFSTVTKNPTTFTA